MKGMTDELRSLGEGLPDRHLILQLLCGLNKKYDHMKALIKRTKLPPSFHDVRNTLLFHVFPGEDSSRFWKPITTGCRDSVSACFPR
jgi:hypothetical protein